MYIEECESNGYVLAHEALSIHSKELRLFRRILRIFGLWHPIEAHFIERIIYPLSINMILLGILVLEVYSITVHGLQHDKSMTAMFILGTSAGIFRYIWAWLCHTFAIKYFKERNLERKLFDIDPTRQFRREFYNMIRNLKSIMTASIFHILLTFAFSIVVLHPEQWIPANARTHGQHNRTVMHIQQGNFHRALTLLMSVSDLYMVPILLCLTWLMYLLSKTSRIRLLQLKHEYMSWNQSVEDAVFHHYTFYTQKVQSNSKAISFLFIGHNVLMIIMTPQHIYLCLEVNRSKGLIDLAIFLYFCLMFLIFWIIPLYFAETLRRNEERFCIEINNFCPQNFNWHCIAEEADEECHAVGTFQSRTEVNKLTSYLKRRKSGFLVGFYSFQLQLSMVSFYVGLLMLILRTMSG